MSSTYEPVRVAVIAGSRRPHRRARAVAEWVSQEPGLTDCEMTVIDLAEVALPVLAEPSPAAFGTYTLDHTRRWSALIDRFDAYVLVTPEYNHSTSAALKDALDHLYREWQDKAVAFVGYGADGGVRAVEHLRGVTAELGLAGVGPSVALNIFDDFSAAGELAPRDRPQQARTRMLTALCRWAEALRTLRAASADNDAGRPVLAPERDGHAESVATELIAALQQGLDDGDADRYDSMFAADVLWGSPYGQVLTGFAPLNTAHRSMMDTPRVGHSRYELVQLARPAADVITAHVRRTALAPAPAGGPDFSEMALYVLIRRGGRWWLSAGQNTPIRDKP